MDWRELTPLDVPVWPRTENSFEHDRPKRSLAYCEIDAHPDVTPFAEYSGS